jgi:hypothetical protein
MKKKMKRIWGVKCKRCNQRLFSLYTHDFRYCSCGATCIDGGRSYLRYGWDPKAGVPTKVYWTEKQDGKYPTKEDKARWPY